MGLRDGPAKRSKHGSERDEGTAAKMQRMELVMGKGEEKSLRESLAM